jgi:hypothetical protein
VAYGGDALLATGLKVAGWGLTSVPAEASDAVAIAAGEVQSLALKTDGTVVMWGNLSSYHSLTNVPAGLSDVVAVACCFAHNLVVKSDGTVKAWGEDLNGQPVSVPSGLSNVVAVAGGAWHSVAMKRDGTVAAWGSVAFAPTNVPAGLNNVVAIQAGYDHNLALRADGTVVVWGSTMPNALTAPTNSPPIVAIAMCDYSGFALKANGTAEGCYSATTNMASGLSSVVAIAAGSTYLLGIKDDGTVAIAGTTAWGQVTNVPTGLRQVAAIAAGTSHCLALAPNVPPQPKPLTYQVAMNGNRIVSPPCYDPNGDSTSYRLASLPERGQLYQYTPLGCGEPIMSPDAAVTDPQGRVIYAPPPGEFGLAYASFTMVANDGEYASAPGTVSLNTIPPPQWQPDRSGRALDGKFTLSFSGFTNLYFGVWVSTNLLDWTRLGWTSESSPGQLQYIDSGAAGNPRRFYQLRLP